MRIILFIILITFQLVAIAQPEGYQSHVLKENSQNTVLYQNIDGTIWIGSTKGLIRYDGTEYELINDPRKDKTSLITSLFQDSKLNLWVGFDNGDIAKVDSTYQLTFLNWNKIKINKKITGITEDTQGKIWISTYGEGLYYSKNNNLINLRIGLPSLDVYSMVSDTQGKIWLGTDEGISIIHFKEENPFISTFNKQDGLKDDIVKVVYRAPDGHILIGFHEGGIAKLKYYNGKIKIKNYNLVAGEITSITEDISGSLWVGTIDKGLWRYKSDFQDIHAVPHWELVPGFETAKIYDVITGIQGNIWISSHQFGLVSKQGMFEHWEIPVKDIQVLDHIHRFWIGTTHGLYEYYHSTGKFEKIELPDHPNANIISLMIDSKKVEWVGTFGQGLFYIEGKNIQRIEGITNDNILSIAENGASIWVATLGGIFTVTKTGEKYKVEDINKLYGLKKDYVYKILIDKQKRIWIGTDGNGLILIDKNKQVKSFNATLGKPLKTIYSIDEDIEGNIWISVASQGIFSYGPKGWKHYGSEKGIRSNNIPNLATDKYGHVLLMNERGIDLLLPKTGNVLNLDKLLSLKNFSANLNMSFKEGNAIWIVNKNEIIYCKALPDSALKPKVIIRSIDVMGKRVNYNTTSFPYNQNFINFNLSGIFYAFQNEVSFDYKLEGYDIEWNNTSDRDIPFQKLNSGKYTLKVYARHGTAKSDMITYSFKVETPIWRQPLFIFMVILFLSGLSLFIIRYREKSLHKTAKLEQDRISAQFEALKSQINPHFLFNTLNTLIALIEEKPASAVKFVEQLSDFYRKILQYREHKLIPVSEEISLVKSFCYLLNERYGDNLIINLDIDHENGFIIPFSLQMLMENAVKHNVISAEKKLRINIEKKDNCITVTNNIQPKLHKEPSTGFGLQSIIQHYEMITKSPVEIEKTKYQFQVKLPILESIKI